MASQSHSSRHGLFVSYDGRYGGDRYADDLYSSLSTIFRDELCLIKIKRAGGLKTLPELVKVLSSVGVDSRCSFLIRPFGLPLYKSNTYVMFHHYAPRYDPWYSQLLQLLDLLIIRLFGGLIGIRIIVVSEYWRRFWEQRGIPVIACLYNTVSVDCSCSPVEAKALISKAYHLDPAKKWVYLGSDHPKKGWMCILRQFHVSDFEKYELIVTGKIRSSLPLNIIWIEPEDYLVFVKSCDLVVAFSLFQEGWCRVVHEAIALGVPVVGNGAGGMSELLALAGLPATPTVEGALCQIKSLFNAQGNSDFLEDYITRNNTHNFGVLLCFLRTCLSSSNT